MTTMWKYISGVVLLFLVGYAAFAGYTSCKAKSGSAAEQQAQVAVGQAQAHEQAAIAIPDHAATIKKLEDRAVKAEATAAQAKAALAKVKQQLTEHPATVTVDTEAVQQRDAVIEKQEEVIKAQDGQIADMTASYQELKLAFTDEQKRSTEYKAGMEFERKARQAQEVATASWKSAVTSAEWKGGFKGAAVGALAGYLLKH